MNKLYFGDNLDWLQTMQSESVDLVYLDPPFNSEASYNILYRSPLGVEDNAQEHAFEDTWRWGSAADHAMAYVRERQPAAFGLLTALNNIMNKSDLMAYLAMMTARLIELHRVLKPTGSLYLHCDPTACHYLKMLLDAVFGAERFVNQIAWKRSHAHSDSKQGSKNYGRVQDTILFYTKGEKRTWNVQYSPYSQEYIERDYRRTDSDGRRYRISDLGGPGGAEKGNPYYEVLGVWRHWRYSKQKMDELLAQGRVIQTRAGAVPQYKRYLDEMPGVPAQDIWSDIKLLNNRDRESLGYPTQKPVALLERIISASSNPGDLVLDPFCGCGTAIDAAQKLKRQWIGIDITVLAIDVVEKRLRHTGVHKGVHYEVEGIPRDMAGAHRLFAEDPYDFQNWALTLVDGQPRAGGKRGADKGVDGLIYYRHDAKSDRAAIVSVKGGRNIHADQVRDLIGAMHNQSADLGVMICLQTPTSAMKRAAAEAGSLESGGKLRPKVQLWTVEQLMSGFKPDLPPVYDIISAIAAARRVASQRVPTPPSQDELRRQPSLKLPISGGKAPRQTELAIDDGIFIAQPEQRSARRRRV